MNGSARAYLLSPSYDRFLVFAPFLLGVGICVLLSLREDLFYNVLAVNLWFLGYHHVISTYTRMSFSIRDLKEHWFHVFFLPVIVCASTILLVQWGGVWTLGTLYLYWQLYHYARQSEGIFKAIGGRQGREPCVGKRRFYFYAPVVAAFFSLSYWSHTTFLGFPIRVLAFPDWLSALGTTFFVIVSIVGVVDVVLKKEAKGFTEFEFFYISHVTMFLLAYVFIRRLDVGWMAINVWHNLQYISFVWLYNNRRFKGRVSRSASFLSTLSMSKNIALYILFCLLVTYVFYKYFVTGVFSGVVSEWLDEKNGIAYLAVPYMIINFHHYIVDSRIWKLKKPGIRENLGLK